MQRFIGSKVAGELSEKLGTEVSVGRVDLGFFNRIIIDDILILDQRQKEMLKASRVSAKIELLPLLDGRVSISAAQLFGARLQLYRDSAGADMNMQFVLDSLASRDTTTHSPLDLRINSLIIRHSNVSYDQLDATQTEGLLNPQHLNLSDISADLVLKALKEDSLNLNIKKLSFREQSGLQVKRLTMHVEASGKQATLKDFLLQLPHSSLTLGDLTARYQFRDKRLVPGSLFYQGTVEESDITLADISCLLPKIQTVTNSLKIVSSFSGTDSSIDIPNLQASSADNTIEVHANGFIHHWDENPAWQIQSDRIRLSEGSTALLKDVIANQQVADIISRLGNITVTGQADGTGRSINSEVHLLSDAGNIEADFNMNQQQQFTAHVESSSLQLNRLLAKMVEAGCEYAFMECSSHAIAQKRIGGLKFAGGLFTNLTRDHLDYHKTVENYRDAKKAFFDGLEKDAFAITNADDKNGLYMVQNTKAQVKTYSIRSMADFKAKIIECHFEGMYLDINGKEVGVQFIGKFNVSNLLAVYGAAVMLGKQPEDILVILSTLKSVSGRLEPIHSPEGYTAIVDYAHTPDALENVLNAIHEVLNGKGKVITVCGAGGNRDKGKRPLMAQEAVKQSDRVIITSDNPRFEEPQDIINDMLEGLDARQMKKVISIVDRREAIRTACMMAEKGDVILIAGKGHEDYQEIQGVKHHFDDKEVVREIFGIQS